MLPRRLRYHLSMITAVTRLIDKPMFIPGLQLLNSKCLAPETWPPAAPAVLIRQHVDFEI